MSLICLWKIGIIFKFVACPVKMVIVQNFLLILIFCSTTELYFGIVIIQEIKI